VRTAGQLETPWHTSTERVGRAAEERAIAEHELAALGRLAGGRRAEIIERVDLIRAPSSSRSRPTQRSDNLISPAS
jgi:hypothetical protein